MSFRWISILATAGLSGALALPALASAAPKAATPQLIERAADEGRIQRDTATLYLAYALGRPAKLPAAYRSDAPWDGTLPLRDLEAAVPRMKPGPKREEAEKIVTAAKPPGGGVSCSTSSTDLANSTSTTHFYVEYGTVGGGLSIADYTASLEEGWTTEVTSFGWAAPPVAPTPAPGGKYHVRIDDLGSGLYGFVSPSGTYAGFVGNNPNTAWNDGDAYASCMVLNRDYTRLPLYAAGVARLHHGARVQPLAPVRLRGPDGRTPLTKPSSKAGRPGWRTRSRTPPTTTTTISGPTFATAWATTTTRPTRTGSPSGA